MGDAVHAEPIIGGNGANAAIIDGAGLAECISRDGPAGIPKWYESRYGKWKQGVERSGRLIAEIHSN